MTQRLSWQPHLLKWGEEARERERKLSTEEYFPLFLRKINEWNKENKGQEKVLPSVWKLVIFFFLIDSTSSHTHSPPCTAENWRFQCNSLLWLISCDLNRRNSFHCQACHCCQCQLHIVIKSPVKPRQHLPEKTDILNPDVNNRGA